MNRIVVIAFLLLSTFGFSQSAYELFDKGNELYKLGQYQEAIEVYEQISDLKVQSDELYFNLGNSYYKLNMVAPSIYNFEKALKINPTNEDAQINLDFANKLALDAIEVLQKTVFQKFCDNLIYKLPYSTWAILAIVFSFMGAILFLLYHFSYSSGKKILFFNTSLLSAILLVIATTFAFKAYSFEENTTMAIVFEKETEIKNAPTFNSDTIFELHEGTKVQVLDAIDDWKKIKLADGKIGWIVGENIKEI